MISFLLGMLGTLSEWSGVGAAGGGVLALVGTVFSGPRKWIILAIGAGIVVAAFLVMQIRIDSRDKTILELHVQISDIKNGIIEAENANIRRIEEANKKASEAMFEWHLREVAGIAKQRDDLMKSLKTRDQRKEEIQRAPSFNDPVPDAFLPLLRMR